MAAVIVFAVHFVIVLIFILSVAELPFNVKVHETVTFHAIETDHVLLADHVIVRAAYVIVAESEN